MCVSLFVCVLMSLPRCTMGWSVIFVIFYCGITPTVLYFACVLSRSECACTFDIIFSLVFVVVVFLSNYSRVLVYVIICEQLLQLHTG